MSSDTFDLQPSQPPTTIVLLYSMFHCAPLDAVGYLYNDLSIIDSDDTMCLRIDEKAILGNPHKRLFNSLERWFGHVHIRW